MGAIRYRMPQGGAQGAGFVWGGWGLLPERA